MNNTIFCSNCGHEISSSDKYCCNCGSKVGSSINSFSSTINQSADNFKETIKNNSTFQDYANFDVNDGDSIDWDNQDMVNLIKNNTSYYIPKFKEMQMFHSNTSWNWASFFFGPLWFLYRKMYLAGFLIFVADMLLVNIPFLGTFVSFAISIGCGVLGNTIYLNQLRNHLKKSSMLDEDFREHYIQKHRGVNKILPAVLIVLLLLFVIVAFLGFGLAFRFSSLLYGDLYMNEYQNFNSSPFNDVPFFHLH